MTDQPHVWNYFRAGGVVQVELKTKADLLQLSQLDQKLWMALSMPTRGVHCDTRTLDLIDTDKDGHIRPPELIEAIQWLDKMLTDPGIILTEGGSVSLAEIKDPALKAGAERALVQLGKQGETSIQLEELDLAVSKLSAEIFNGDGIIIPDAGQEPAVKGLIEHIIQHYASVPDRSGHPGIDKTIVENFFKDLDARAQWFAELEQQPQLVPLGAAGTALAFQATDAVSNKIEDFFTRCHWVAFDARASAAANRSEAEFAAIASQQLNPNSEELAQLPLANVTRDLALPLDDRLNPAWHKPMQYFVETAVQTTLGVRPEVLTEAQWRQIQKSLQPYAAWRGREPQSRVSLLDMQKIKEIRASRSREALDELLGFDLAIAPEYNSLSDVLRLLLYRRDLGLVLRNFVNFSDFYRRKKSIFQAGTLFIDGRAAELCIEVSNPTKHTTMAGLSGAYLAYCDLLRAGQQNRAVVALLTDGDSDNISVGRNGVFYDRLGRDWEATITRIVANPISLREAFWTPYKKVARFFEEQIAKRAAAADAVNVTQLSTTTQAMANADKAKVPENALGKKIDVGTVAALGVALGSISTFFGVLFSQFLNLGILMPFGILALILLISGPSMVMAWLKLKSRNLGPILDANGWAINTVARINVPFAASMTSIREVPLHAGMLKQDPYAEKKRPWRFYGTLALIIILALAWAMGRCDRYLPEKIRSQNVFGSVPKL
ncbi:MAG TPA: hypothetical protein VFO10_26615 [Oligoflexus sp.]|uniref:hypothetical protein n=1 Tax=Oligoflexus sp. TaxID=1971216 RepID=UPI002D7FB60A|nr:hypothetical protein [Oligoflexus sp.]HET9240866.1 hypothetical protein [Oligoflexus sp.]